MMGIGNNNWKVALANFLIIFAVQVIFGLQDLMQTDIPEIFPFLKMIVNAAVATLIFYGYNKVTKQKDDGFVVKPS